MKKHLLLFLIALFSAVGFAHAADQVFELVTSTSAPLKAGDKILIVGHYTTDKKNYALGTANAATDNNRNAVEVTVTNNTITLAESNTDVERINIEDSGDPTYPFALYATIGQGYLYTTSTSKNYCKLTSTKTTSGTYVKFDLTGSNLITSNYTTKNQLRFNYNSGTPIYAFYSSGQINPSIYRLKVEEPAKTDPVIYFTDFTYDDGAYKAISTYTTTTQDVENGSLSLTPYEKTSNGAIKNFTVTSSNPGVATIDENNVINLVGNGTTTITATFAGNDTYNPGTGTLELTVEGMNGNAKKTYTPSWANSTVTLTPGATYQLPLGDEYPYILFWTDDETIATVTEEGGLITAAGIGSTTINATWEDDDYADGEATLTVVVEGKDPELSVKESLVRANINGTYDLASNLINPHNLPILWSINPAEGIATLDTDAGTITTIALGEVTARATFKKNDEYNGTWKQFTIRVIDPNASSAMFDFTKPKELNPAVDEPEQSKGTDLSSKVLTSEDVTCTFGPKPDGKTESRIFNSQGTIDLRIYEGAYFTISVPEGYTIKKMSFTKAGGSYAFGADKGNFDASAQTWTPDEGNTDAITTVKFTATGGSRISTIEVEYGVYAPAPVLTNPGLTFTDGDGNATTTLNITDAIVGRDYVLPVVFTNAADLAVNGNVSVTTSDENVATWSAGKVLVNGNGTATLTATFAGNDTYEPATATCEVSVSGIEDDDAPATIVFTPALTFNEDGEVTLPYGTKITFTVLNAHRNFEGGLIDPDGNLTPMVETNLFGFLSGDNVACEYETVEFDKTYSFTLVEDAELSVMGVGNDSEDFNWEYWFYVARPEAPTFTPAEGEVAAGTTITASAPGVNLYLLTVLNDANDEYAVEDQLVKDDHVTYTITEDCVVSVKALLPNYLKYVDEEWEGDFDYFTEAEALYTIAEVIPTVTVTTTVDDDLTAPNFSVKTNTYGSYKYTTSKSGAEYEANMNGVYITGENQSNTASRFGIKASNNIVVTKSAGVVTKLVLKQTSSQSTKRSVKIYGQNTAYTTAATTQANSNFTNLVGTVELSSGNEVEFEVPADKQYKYIAIVSPDGASQFDYIRVTWSSTKEYAVHGVDLSVKDFNVDNRRHGAATVNITAEHQSLHSTDNYTSDDLYIVEGHHSADELNEMLNGAKALANADNTAAPMMIANLESATEVKVPTEASHYLADYHFDASKDHTLFVVTNYTFQQPTVTATVALSHTFSAADRAYNHTIENANGTANTTSDLTSKAPIDNEHYGYEADKNLYVRGKISHDVSAEHPELGNVTYDIILVPGLYSNLDDAVAAIEGEGQNIYDQKYWSWFTPTADDIIGNENPDPVEQNLVSYAVEDEETWRQNTAYDLNQDGNYNLVVPTSEIANLSADGKYTLVARAKYSAPGVPSNYTAVAQLDKTTTGVEAIVADSNLSGADGWYNLQGVRIDRPVRGAVYIRIDSGRASKQLVK